MLISIDWIKDFVELGDVDPKELGSRFTLSTAEVEDIVITGEAFKKIVVAQIVEIEKHPDADKLNLVKFDIGGKIKQVVCGASNVKIGLKAPYAPLGTLLPNGLLLEPRKIRGILSEGMLCSEEELGFASESDGILEFSEEAPVGQDIGTYLNLDHDVLLDIDNKSLTHRPDLWGHFGHAREMAVIYKKEFKNPFTTEWQKSLNNEINNTEESPIEVTVDKGVPCSRYYGLSLKNIKVGESPDWLKKRLVAVGLRTINNIVDISNYVMLELGHPLHIFDADKIEGGKVHIRAIQNEEVFKTLDEIDRNLISGDTIIADCEKPLVLAGIMGGENSGVDENTKNIFIEVANWNASDIRNTSTRLGLRTDSSQRYEKTLDDQQCLQTLYRTFELIKKVCPEGRAVGKIELAGNRLNDFEVLKIETSFKKINKVLGKEIEREEVSRIFNGLAFKLEEKGDAISIRVPSFRATKDIEFEADLIEEVGRIVGYDSIIASSPDLNVRPVELSSAKKIERKIRDFMVLHAQSTEVVTYPMIGKSLLKKADWKSEESLKLINPLSHDQEIMRDSLLPSILNTVALNQKNYSEFNLFEIGRTYHQDEKSFAVERNVLGIAFFNKSLSPFMSVLNSVERLMGLLNVKTDFLEKNTKFENNLISHSWSGLHPHEFLDMRIMGKLNGAICSVHPLLLRNFKIKGNLTVALIDLTSLAGKALKRKNNYKPLLKFPNSVFDWTVIITSNQTVESVLKVAKKVKIKEMVTCNIVDIFHLDDERKAVTLRATLSDSSKTLDGDFIQASMNKLVESMEKAGFPLKK